MRMKFLTVSLIALAISFLPYLGPCLPSQGQAEAAGLEENEDGLSCWNGDENFPLWSTGNKFGSFLDVGSAVLQSLDDDNLQIAVLFDIIDYSEGEMRDQDVIYFTESLSAGKVYYEYGRQSGQRHELNPMQKPEGRFMNDAYYAVKCAVLEE